MTRLAPIALAFFLAGCGYVGEPQPPALKIPVAVKDLKAHQSGAKILLEFTVPDRTTEELTLPRIGEIEIKGGAAPEGEFSTGAWAAAARSFDSPTPAPGATAHAEIPASGWVGKTLILGVRVANSNGRFSDWSNLVSFPVVEPLPRPESLASEAVTEGVRLRWRVAARPGLAFRILRRTGQDEQPVQVGRAESNEWTDTAARFGTSYEYRIQATLSAGNSEAESEISDPVSILPRDTFAPATPKGLTAIAAAGAIELGWERNTESDLAGYAVYRSKNGGKFERIGERVTVPSFTDRGVENGAKYAYAVTSVDQEGNESPRSAVAEVELR